MLRTRLEVWTKLVPLYAGSVLLAISVLLPVGPRRALALLRGRALQRPPRRISPPPAAIRSVAAGLVVLALGCGAGLIIAWLASDVVDVVGVHFTSIIRMWCALAFGGVAVGVHGLVRRGAGRRIQAAALIPASLLAGAFGINVDVAAYPTLGALFHRDAIPALALPVLPARLVDAADWRPRGQLPAHGVLGTVRIPARLSHFGARPAVVYLPPAALTRDPPRLPVILSLSGQPGWPTDVFVNGGLSGVLDRYAAENHGIAPIVIAADQIGLPGNNPMCLDSRLGRVDTYLTRDVPDWARTHLPVRVGGWGVEGFSEGGTCVLQLLPTHRRLFTAGLAIAPELAEEDRGVPNTVREAFHGDLERYLAATPVRLLRRLGPFPEDLVVIGWGAADTDYGADAAALANAAARAGLVVSVVRLPDSAHDWHTVQGVLGIGVPEMAQHLLRR